MKNMHQISETSSSAPPTTLLTSPFPGTVARTLSGRWKIYAMESQRQRRYQYWTRIRKLIMNKDSNLDDYDAFLIAYHPKFRKYSVIRQQKRCSFGPRWHGREKYWHWHGWWTFQRCRKPEGRQRSELRTTQRSASSTTSHYVIAQSFDDADNVDKTTTRRLRRRGWRRCRWRSHQRSQI